jgi:glycogen(starch) synthase
VTPLRVLMTTDVVGGVWDFSLTLARALATNAHVELLAIGDPSIEQRRAAHEAGVHLHAEPLKLEWMADAQADVARTRTIVAEVADAMRADVIHANQFAAACANTAIPSVLTVHSDVLSWRRWTLGSDETPSEWEAYAALVREALGRAGRVVAVSDFLRREVSQLYECARPIDVIHNGWPAATSDTGDSERGPITLIAGRIWDAAKDVTLAVDAAQGWDPADVLLAGTQTHPDGGGTREIPSPLRALGYVDRPTLDGWLDRAALYLSPARYDPFGLLPLQAALHGCALLLSDIPSYRELWDGVACFFRSNDAADLRASWQALLVDAPRRQALARAAHERARTHYTVDRMAQAYSELFAQAAHRLRAAA